MSDANNRRRPARHAKAWRQRVARKMTIIAAGTAASTGLTGKYRLLAATNFKFVAIGIFEKEGVITGTVAFANFRTLELFPAGFAHELCNLVHLFPRVGPKRDARAIRFMVLIRTKAKEFRRFVSASGIKRMKVSPWFFVNKPKLRQKFSIKLSCHSHVFHPQINVIKATRFHAGFSISWQLNSILCDAGSLCRTRIYSI
jgi:hypothetical protein